MIRITEEQKGILSLYTGEKNQIISEIQAGMELLRSNGEDQEMQELMEDLFIKLNTCTDREFSLLYEDRLIDTEAEETGTPEDSGGTENEWENNKGLSTD